MANGTVAGGARKPTMPFERTITIVSNSGKIINTGKQIVASFKEAHNSYLEKKAELKIQRHLKRAQTFDANTPIQRANRDSPRTGQAQIAYGEEDFNRRPRRSFDDQSVASSRHSRSSRNPQARQSKSRGQRLTEENLDALSDVSSVVLSRPPLAYHNPYVESQSAGITSRAQLTNNAPRSIAGSDQSRRQGGQLVRRHSASDLALQRIRERDDDYDADLAYGNIPPDLEARRDLEKAKPPSEDQVTSLIHKIEDILDEAACIEHGATAMIKQLQERPDAAAAVALALAELSAIVGKMSPGLLGILKGGSPAVFALLASPQFLIGTGIAVGVTVVMFGGWKIVQKVREGQQAMAFSGTAAEQGDFNGVDDRYGEGVDEALVLEDLDDSLSSIETWRRGIAPSPEEEIADLELITPRADRERRGGDDDDTKSRRSAKSSRSSKSEKPHHKSSRSDREREHKPERERKSEREHRHEREKERDSSDKKKSSSGSSKSSAPSQAPKKASKPAKSTVDRKEEKSLTTIPFKQKFSLLMTGRRGSDLVAARN